MDTIVRRDGKGQEAMQRLNQAIQEEIETRRSLRAAKYELLDALTHGDEVAARSVHVRYGEFLDDLLAFQYAYGAAQQDDESADEPGGSSDAFDIDEERLARETLHAVAQSQRLSSGDLTPFDSLTALRSARGLRCVDLASGLRVGEDVVEAIEAGGMRLAPERMLILLGAILQVNAQALLLALHGTRRNALRQAGETREARETQDFLDLVEGSQQTTKTEKLAWLHDLSPQLDVTSDALADESL